MGGNRMFRSWKFIFLVMALTLFLTACGKTLEENADAGLKSAEQAFFESDKVANEEVGDVKFYRPNELSLKEESDTQNIILTTKDDTFILFNNPNEETNSHLFYDLLKADTTKVIVDEKTFTEGDTFGFAAVVESNDKVELITSVGGTKITTLSNQKDVEKNLVLMMEILRSIK